MSEQADVSELPAATGNERRGTARRRVLHGVQAWMQTYALPLRLRDMSVGGFAIAAGAGVPIGERFEFRFKFGSEPSLTVWAKSLHTRRMTERGETVHITGFEFQQLDEQMSRHVAEQLARAL